MCGSHCRARAGRAERQTVPGRAPPAARRGGQVTDDALARTPLFAALDAEAAEALRSTMVDVKLPRGDSLFSEGDPGDRLYVILDGKIKLGATSGDGRETLLAILGPGEMFGEL